MAATVSPAVLRYESGSELVRRKIFPAFLIFSVCFYAYRFLLGMGSGATTIYDSDAPVWLRITKDAVWMAVLGAALLFSGSESWEFARLNRRAHRGFFRALFLLICLFLVMNALHVFYYQSALDTFLFWVRYPLEYMPLAFFLPLFVLRWEEHTGLLLGLGWLSIGYLLFEIFSGLQVGFYGRFGSILGSPNDYGVFCALFVLGLLVAARKWWHWVLLGAMLCGLVLTVSRSAMAGLAAGLCALLYLRRGRIGALALILILASAVAVLMAMFPELLTSPQVRFGLEHFSTTGMDISTATRVNELQLFETRFGDLDLRPLLLGTDYFHIESWYLALLVRTGTLGLSLWLVVIGATVVRGWRKRNASAIYGVALSAVVCISTASAFVPYPDTFPTNVWLWLAVGTIWMPVEELNSPRISV